MRNNRRGFTLAELSIVLAVLAIVSTMVVSFTIMANKNTQVSTARLEALQDIRVAEAIIEDFIEGKSSITITTYNTEEIILTDNEGKTLTFNKTNKTFDVEDEETITLSRVESITFEYNGESTEKIIYCTIKYTVGEQKPNYTFCVYSYANVTMKEVTDDDQG